MLINETEWSAMVVGHEVIWEILGNAALRKGVPFALSAVGTFILSSFLWTLVAHAEPQYDGRPLEDWAFQSFTGDSREKAQARQALRAMGEPAVSCLVRSLEQNHPAFTKPSPSGPRTDLTESRISFVDATRALGEIGPAASNAVPALLRIIQADPNHTHPSEVAAIMKIRGESIEPLVRTLEDTDLVSTDDGRRTWLVAASTLQEFGTNGAVAVPTLCRVLTTTKNRVVVVLTVEALHEIHSNAPTAVPVLIDMLQRFKNDNLVPMFATDALAEFGADARSGVPAIRQWLSVVRPTDYLSKYKALTALCRILPPTEIQADEVKALVSVVTDPRGHFSEHRRKYAGALLRPVDPQAAATLGVK